MEKIKVICIVGPTASGKTSLGIKLAKELNGEIISADSMQVYKGLPIASAVATDEEKQGIPHYLTEYLEPQNQLTVADYTHKAHIIIKDIYDRGKTPIIVGGTGLYIDSVIKNITFTDEKFSSEIRKRLEAEYDETGGENMHKKLSLFDEESAKRISPNDKKRLVRAFEIYENSGITMSRQYELSTRNESPYAPLYIGIKYMDRQKLYDRINLRVDIMKQNGLIDEARKFYNMKNENAGAFCAIGHKELFPFFENKITLDEALENLKMQTRRYAKRQLTWFNKNESINWIFADITPDLFGESIKIIKKEHFYER